MSDTKERVETVERKAERDTDDVSVGKAIWYGTVSGCVFAVAVLLGFIVIGWASAGLSHEIALCLSIILMGLATGILQQLWFNCEPVVVRISYPVRVVGFAVLFYPCLAGCAVLGSWFPMGAGQWLLFTLIYLAFLALFTAIFGYIYRKENREYDRKLQEHRAARAGK